MTAALSLTPSELVRFNSFLDKNDAVYPQCWVWTGAKNRGYGIFQATTLQPRTRRANRLAYQLWVGPIPKGLQVQHKCDNPACCNPQHLFLGTAAQNSRQMVGLGRAATGIKHGMAKLTAQQVSDIRVFCTQGLQYRAIAARFGISESHVRNIDRRRRRLKDGNPFNNPQRTSRGNRANG